MGTAERAEVDVVIIGAGVAGLHAAHLLATPPADATRRPSTVVLEGRDRVGGRLLSLERGAGGIDLGATWFWSNEPLVNALVEQLSLASFAQHIDGDMMYQPDDQARRIDGNQMASPASRLTEGTQAIAEALAERLPPDTIRLKQTVRAVTSADSGTRLVVTADDATWLAQQVIVAVPPATAMAVIDFGAGLSDAMAQLAAATPVWMGATTKIVARYNSAFWRAEGLAGAAFSQVGPMREIHDMSGPDGANAALFGFAQPAPGEEPPTPERAVAQLVAIFGVAASTPTEVIVHDWRREPLTSPPGVERLSAYETYGHQLYQQAHVGGRLHWASTETSRPAPGHIEGALWASSRASHAVLTTLPPTI